MPHLADHTVFAHVQERFETRARALFYARLALMTIGLAVLAVPSWREFLGVSLPVGAYWYLFVLAYHVGSYLWVGRRFDRVVIFVTLCLDLLVTLYLVAASGGIKSPLMPTQLVFTMLFALLYPSPLALVPPLLTLPVVAKIDQILGIHTFPGDLLLVLWYTALNITVVYVVVYLEGRERIAFQEVVRLQRERRQSALDDERARIAREIHDSVGAALSSVMLQAEYLVSQLPMQEKLRAELEELREAASEGMEELRRAVSIMRHEFQLIASLSDHVEAFGQRHRIQTRIEVTGLEQEMDPEHQLVLFRILQEALANVAQHASADNLHVQLVFGEREVTLQVRDDGKGFEPEQGIVGHYGLRNMTERAVKVGGQVRITSTVGQGSCIEVNLPRETSPTS